MVTVREYKPSDFEEVVNMYYDMIHEVYPHRTFKDKQYFYMNVQRWVEWRYDIIVTEEIEEITGFALCYMDSMGGICDDYYNFECLYVKPKYRKSRSTYLLVYSAIEFAQSQGIILSASASDISECSKMVSKLGAKVFTKYERLPKRSTK